MKRTFHRLNPRRLQRHRGFLAFTLVAVLGIAGFALISSTQADSVFQAGEAEAGLLAGPVSALASSGASGNSAVRFGFGAPANFEAITGGNSIVLLWDLPQGSTYRTEIFRNNIQVATVTPGQGVVRADKLGTRYIDSSVVKGASYQYKIRFVHSDGSLTAFSSLSVTAPANTTAVPTISIDTSQAPDLEPYMNTQARREIETWYPKISDRIAYPTDTPRSSITIVLDASYTGVASAVASTGTVRVNPAWLRSNQEDGGGMFVHEVTHLIQNYPSGVPGWVTEGLADWTRDWFMRERRYVPARNAVLGPYSEGGYALHWLEQKYKAGIIREINIAAHNGTYSNNLVTSASGGKSPEQVFIEARDAYYAGR